MEKAAAAPRFFLDNYCSVEYRTEEEAADPTYACSFIFCFLITEASRDLFTPSSSMLYRIDVNHTIWHSRDIFPSPSLYSLVYNSLVEAGMPPGDVDRLLITTTSQIKEGLLDRDNKSLIKSIALQILKFPGTIEYGGMETYYFLVPQERINGASSSSSSSSVTDIVMPQESSSHYYEHKRRCVPAAEEFIDALERINASEECPICRVELLQPVVTLAYMPCRHLFHEDCIVQWLNKDHTCPLCRDMLPIQNPLTNSPGE